MAERTRFVLDRIGGQRTSLVSISREVGVSVFHLCRIFHKVTGQTLARHHLQVRALRQTLEVAVPRLEQLSEQAAGQSQAPGKWSPKQIVGHLIDSACNNHLRFVRAQLSDDLICERYEQEQWVALQGYERAPWRELVSLWELYNRHLLRVMMHTPVEQRSKPRRDHNLHLMSTSGVAASEPATLDHLMADYVKHLRGHVRQILPDL